MASGKASMAEPFVRSGVRPAYPVRIIVLTSAHSPDKSIYVKGTVGAYLPCGAHNSFLLIKPFKTMRSLRAHAISATLLCFPEALRC